MIVRQAEIGDIAAVSKLARKTYSKSFGHSFNASDLAFHLKNNLSDAYFLEAMAGDVILVALVKRRLVGFVQFGAMSIAMPTQSPDEQELRRLYVHADFQSTGIGRRLMQAALNHPRLDAAERIYVDVWERNLGAKRLYERFGFEVVGAHALKVASGVAGDLDLVMMRPSKPRAGPP